MLCHFYNLHLLGNKICKDMKDPTLERSHTSAKAVTSGLIIKEIYKYMKDPTLERSHTSAKHVTSAMHKRVI